MTANERPDWCAGLPDSLKDLLPSSPADLPEGVRRRFGRLLCAPAMEPVWRALDQAKLKAHINPADRPVILEGYLCQALWADGTALPSLSEQRAALAEVADLAQRLAGTLGGSQEGLRSSPAYPGLEERFRTLPADDPLAVELVALVNGVNAERVSPALWAPLCLDALDAGDLGVWGPWAVLSRLVVLLPLLSQLAQRATPQLRGDGSAPRKVENGPRNAYARRLCRYCRQYYVDLPGTAIAATTRSVFGLEDDAFTQADVSKLCRKTGSKSR